LAANFGQAKHGGRQQISVVAPKLSHYRFVYFADHSGADVAIENHWTLLVSDIEAEGEASLSVASESAEAERMDRAPKRAA
jgi:hypothetical protein